MFAPATPTDNLLPAQVVRLSSRLPETLAACSVGETAAAPKQVLTKPGTPAGNDGKDNLSNDLIVAVDDVLLAPSGRRCARALWWATGAGAGCSSCSALCARAARWREAPTVLALLRLTRAPPAHARRLVVLDMLGCGTFGQVVKCRCADTGEARALVV